MSGWTSRTLAGLAAWLALTLVLAGPAWSQALPMFSDTGPEAVEHGQQAGYPPSPKGTRPAQGFLVGYHTRMDTLYPHNVVHRAAAPSPLKRAAAPLSVSYTFKDQTYSISDYLDRQHTTGLLVARGDTILFEQYRYARTDRDRFLSQSMAKSVTAMLVGIAAADGAIRSIDQPAADYVPDLAGTAYGQTSIRHLLQMASGVRYTERYDGQDDHATLGRALFGPNNPGAARALAQFNQREAEPGTRFRYASAETEVLGLVVMGATGMPMARYLETRLWQPMGAEADATWIVDTRGQELGYCCLSAVLRDWARLGLVLAHDGAWNGRQIIPRDWLMRASTESVPPLPAGEVRRTTGYGFQLWLLPGNRRQFTLRGIHGQLIYVDPALKLVMVHTAVRPRPAGDPGLTAETSALWYAIMRSQGG